jgi:hypothetical protein
LFSALASGHPEIDLETLSTPEHGYTVDDSDDDDPVLLDRDGQHIDMESVNRWDDYSAAKEEMFAATDTDAAPWIVVKSSDKKRARINAMRYLLAQFDYDDKDADVVGDPDPLIVGRALAD